MELQMIKPMCSMERVLASAGRPGWASTLGFTARSCLLPLLLITGCAQQPIADRAPPSAAHSIKPAVEPSSTQRATADFSHFVPEYFSVHSDHRGDLDADGDEDLLVVLTSTDVSRRKDDTRTLMVFQRNSRGKLEKSVHNPSAILCESCGGMMGDPLQGIYITSDGFLLRFEGGSRELWSREYHFVYSAAVSTWLLEEFTSAAFDKISEASGSSRLTSGILGPITIEEFNPGELREPQLW